MARRSVGVSLLQSLRLKSPREGERKMFNYCRCFFSTCMYSSAIELVAHELVQRFARAHNVTVISSDRCAVSVEMRVSSHSLYAQGV